MNERLWDVMRNYGVGIETLQGDEQQPALGYIGRSRDIVGICDMLVAAPRSMEGQQMSGT